MVLYGNIHNFFWLIVFYIFYFINNIYYNSKDFLFITQKRYLFKKKYFNVCIESNIKLICINVI